MWCLELLMMHTFSMYPFYHKPPLGSFLETAEAASSYRLESLRKASSGLIGLAPSRSRPLRTKTCHRHAGTIT